MPTQTRANGNQVRMLRTLSNGVSADKAFQLAKSEGLTLISNAKADDLLRTDEWKTVKEAWPIHTGTMAAFTEPGKKLGAIVKYKDPGSGLTWVFEVPAGTGFRDLKDALLAVEYPNYNLEVDAKKKRVIVTPQKKLILPVTNFPATDGWYAIDSATGIPVNKPLDSSNPDARYLYRISQRVGPVVRGVYDGGVRRGVVLGNYVYDRPSYGLGVLTVGDSHGVAAAAKPTLAGLTEKVKSLEIELEQARAKSQLAKDMATDVKPKLEDLKKVVKLETLKELIELIKLHTEQ